jgi:hypothetical protein
MVDEQMGLGVVTREDRRRQHGNQDGCGVHSKNRVLSAVFIFPEDASRSSDFECLASDFLKQSDELLPTVPEQFRSRVIFKFAKTGDDSRGNDHVQQAPETEDWQRTGEQYELRSRIEAETRDRIELPRLKAKYEREE